MTNDSVFNGVNQLPKAANRSLSDFELYLNNTQYELDILFKTNFAQLESQLKQNLNKSGDIVKNRLAVISEAISINNLTQIVSSKACFLESKISIIKSTFCRLAANSVRFKETDQQHKWTQVFNCSIEGQD